MDVNNPVLIVEDDQNDAILLKRALLNEGITCPVQTTADGQEAINYLCGKGLYSDRATFPFPKVIFTDLKMPRVSGFDFLQWLKKHPECGVIPIIVLTSSNQDSDVKLAYELGANAYLVKPPTMAGLQDMVKIAFRFWALCEKPVSSNHC